MEKYLQNQDGSGPSDGKPSDGKVGNTGVSKLPAVTTDFPSGSQVKGDVYKKTQTAKQGNPSVRIDPTAYAATVSSDGQSYDTLNPFAGEDPSKYGSGPPPSDEGSEGNDYASQHLDQTGGWYGYDNWGNLILHNEEEEKKKRAQKGPGSHGNVDQRTTSGSSSKEGKPSGGWNGDVRTQHLYTDDTGWPKAKNGGHQTPAKRRDCSSGGNPTVPNPQFGTLGSAGSVKGNDNGPKPLTRRSSMAPGLQQVYDADPSFKGLGLDSYSQGQDGI